MESHLNKAAIAFIAFVALVATENSAHACYGSPMLTPFGHTSTMTMTVRSGRPRDIAFSSLGPVTSTTVDKRPAHGAVVVDSFGRVVYRSRPNFIGEDSFRYSRRGFDHLNKPIVTYMQVAVKVVR
jgi:hypothetical protein